MILRLHTRYQLLIFALVTTWFLQHSIPVQAAPQINSITPNTTTVAKYDKLEINLDISNINASNYQFPYDPATPTGLTDQIGVSIDAHFLPPGETNWNNAFTQPAFYYQDFEKEVKQNQDWLYPTNTFRWLVRFSPNQVGQWQYRINATDQTGSSTSTTQSFTVTNSTNKGFIRVSQTDPRYFEYEDGTFFPALGYNYNVNRNSIDSTVNRINTISQNGVQLGRTWLSSWNIFGSSWHPWYGMPNHYGGYIPREGLEANDGEFRLKLVYRGPNPSNPDGCSDNCSWWVATRFIGWQSPRIPVKQNTNYQIKVRYKASNITGPRNSAHTSYGPVAKLNQEWLEGAHNAGVGTPITNYGRNTADWEDLTGTWNSGMNHYLPYLYLTLENVIDPGSGGSAPVTYIDSVSVTEIISTNTFGPNIIYKPDFKYNTYFDQRNSFYLDQVLDSIKDTDFHFRFVITEKGDFIYSHLDGNGNAVTPDNSSNLYQSGSHPVRWLHKAWWRYLQARWGYSPNIHSWELVNEADPGSSGHYETTDALGSFMRQFSPNHHMVSSSTWSNFPASSWLRPNIDFADVHAYISTGGFLYGSDQNLRNSMVTDVAKYHLEYGNATRSMLNNAAASSNVSSRPIIRGEAGIDMYFANNTNQNEQPNLAQDSNGVWLHNYLWAGLDDNGMIESYWWTNNINTKAGPDGNTGNGLNEVFKFYQDFVRNIPLNNGNYNSINIPQTSEHRFVGQIDPVNNRAHLWVQNLNHTWRKVVDGNAAVGVPNTVTLSGFNVNQTTSVPIELHLFNTSGVPTIQSTNGSIASNGNLNITIPSNTNYTDVAIKIGSYSNITPNPTASPSPSTSTTPPMPGDVNSDNQVSLVDYNIIISNFGRTSQSGPLPRIEGDLDQNGTVDLQDYNQVVSNFGNTR